MVIKKTEVKNKKAKASGSDKKVSISSISNNQMIRYDIEKENR